MIAVDTNILTYAHREDSEWHEQALRALVVLVESGDPWGIPWPCVHEFIAITTHPKIYRPPSPLNLAQDAIERWLSTPTCVPLGEEPGYFECLKQISLAARLRGPMVHDARIAAICVHSGVRTLWTADRDFSRYQGLSAVNPLVDDPGRGMKKKAR